MAKQKQYVFSARTTEEGLKQLNELKGRLNVGWDDLVIDAVCAHYGLEKAAMALPKAEKPAKKGGTEEVAAAATEAAGTAAQPSEASTEETTVRSGKATKRHGKQKGGKKHGKAKTATEHSTNEATDS